MSRTPTPSSGGPGFRRGKRISDLMTREHLAFVESSLAAERAGDAETALEYHQGIPMFARSAHRILLTQLSGLADEMTPWMWSRWAAYQCTRAEDPGTECQALTRFALDYTLRMFHADEMQATYDAGGDPMRVMAPVLGQDWAFHQVLTYELGGLELFLDTMVTGRLAEECRLARSWVEATMGGYRIETSRAGDLVVRDVAGGQPLPVLDLGARVHADAGGHVLGRLVPSGTTPALLFDTRPLPVDEVTARTVAESDDRMAWITALEHALHDGRVDRSRLRSEDRELVTDVPSRQLVEVGTPPALLDRTMEQLGRGRDGVGRAAFRILRGAVDGTFEADHAEAYVAAAVLIPHAHREALRHLVGPEHREAWARWADRVPDPARGRFQRLAGLGGAAAA